MSGTAFAPSGRPDHRAEALTSAGNPCPVDERETMIAQLRKQVDILTRENRALKIAVGELERVSERDTLTPLYNRRYFITALHHRMARRERYNEKAAVIYVDVNGLKAINDRSGHGAGDFALVEVAHRLASGVRASDVVARIGGDEFGIILDHVEEAAAREQVDRLRASLITAAQYGDKEISLNASFGLTMLADGDTEEAILARADADMYANKRG